MEAFAFPQGADVGGRWIGVDATPTGTNPANDVVVDWTGSTQRLFAAPSVPVPVIAMHSQTLGSTFKIALEGIWWARSRFNCPVGALIAMGMTLDAAGADLNTDPFVTSDTILDVCTNGANGFMAPYVDSGPMVITRRMALDPTLAMVRVLASNLAGAGVDPAGLFLTNTYVVIKRIGDVPAQLRG